nr:class I SAM-dependent methyltransferase [Xenophilus azovorans]
MDTGFYRAFENRFRGSRELIASRLRAYLPFLHPLKSTTNTLRAVDLGCGRGEWLELLRDEGFTAEGVDSDEGMLAACVQRQLNVHLGDAIAFLNELHDDSVHVVSAFHVVEHIPFEALQQLVKQAMRVLAPGGLLIMETPNPENLQVGAHTFYMDPTHRRPIPPALLAFLSEYCGFERIKILRLQEPSRLHDPGAVGLVDVLCNVSPDYAVIAQKKGGHALLARFDDAFNRSFGLTLERLAGQHDAQGDEARAAIGDSAKAAAERAEAARQLAEDAFKSATDARQFADDTMQVVHQMNSVLQDLRANVVEQAQKSAQDAQSAIQQARAEAAELRAANAELQLQVRHYQRLTQAYEQQISELLHSTSWRATAPLRAVKDKAASLASAIKRLTKASKDTAARSTGALRATAPIGAPRFSEAPTKRSVDQIITRIDDEIRASNSDQARK